MIRKIKTVCEKVNLGDSVLPRVIQFTQQTIANRKTDTNANIGVIGSGNFCFSLEFYDIEDAKTKFKTLYDTISSSSKVSSISKNQLFNIFDVYQLGINYAQNALSINNYDFYLSVFDSEGCLINKKDYCLMRSYIDKKIYVIFLKKTEGTVVSSYNCLITPVLFHSGFNTETYKNEFTKSADDIVKAAKFDEINGITYFYGVLNNYSVINNDNLNDFSLYVKKDNEYYKLYKEAYEMSIVTNPDYQNEYISEQSNVNRDYFKMLMSQKYSDKISSESSIENAVGIALYVKLNDGEELYIIRNNRQERNKEKRKSNYNILYFDENGCKIPFPTTAEEAETYGIEGSYTSVIKDSIDLPVYGFSLSNVVTDSIFNLNAILKSGKIFSYNEKILNIDHVLVFKDNKLLFTGYEINNNNIKFKSTLENVELLIYCCGERIQTENNVLNNTTLNDLAFNNIFYNEFDNYNNPNIIIDGAVTPPNFEQKDFYMFSEDNGLLYDGELYVTSTTNNENTTYNINVKTSEENDNEVIAWKNYSTELENSLILEKNTIKTFVNDFITLKTILERKLRDTKIENINLSLTEKHIDNWKTNTANNLEFSPFKDDTVNDAFDRYKFIVLELSSNEEFNILLKNKNGEVIRKEIKYTPYQKDNSYYYCDLFLYDTDHKEDLMVIEPINESSTLSVSRYNYCESVAYPVIFKIKYKNHAAYSTWMEVLVLKDGLVAQPSDPYVPDLGNFRGWFPDPDENSDIPFNFGTKITSTTILYAKFSF